MGEPWVISPPGLTIEDVKGVWNAGGEHIATFHDADARRRALACVNACAGIETDVLENEWIQGAFAENADESEILVAMLRERDERIRKLEEAVGHAHYREHSHRPRSCDGCKNVQDALGEGWMDYGWGERGIFEVAGL